MPFHGKNGRSHPLVQSSVLCLPSFLILQWKVHLFFFRELLMLGTSRVSMLVMVNIYPTCNLQTICKYASHLQFAVETLILLLMITSHLFMLKGYFGGLSFSGHHVNFTRARWLVLIWMMSTPQVWMICFCI